MIGKIVFIDEKSERLEIRELNICLETLRSLLNGGYLESTVISEEFFKNKIYVLIDEEGKLKNLDPKIIILDKNNKMMDVIVGPTIFIGLDGTIGDFCPLNNKQINFIYNYFQDKTIEIEIGNSKKRIFAINY